MSQRELARRSGISVRALRYIELDQVRNPRPESLRRLTRAVGLDPVDDPESVPVVETGVRLGVLGQLLFTRNGRPIQLGSRKQRDLLGLLALQPGVLFSRADIIDVLWENRPPRTCAGLVHSYVSRLRKTLRAASTAGDQELAISAEQGGYRLVAEPGCLDLVDFDGLVAMARRQSNDLRRFELLGNALERWRAAVVCDLSERVRRHPAAVSAAQRRTAALLCHADLAFQLGHPDRGLERLAPIAVDDPLHEGLQSRMMLLLGASGQQAAALRLFRTVRTQLVDELGVEPGPALLGAYQRVVEGDEHSYRPAVPARATTVTVTSAPPVQLPPEPGVFAGRQRELGALDQAADARVVLVTGAAGVGKTALAVRWANLARHRFPDGALFLDLQGHLPGGALDPDGAVRRLLNGLGVPPNRIPAEPDGVMSLYRSLLAGRRMLILFDNAAGSAQVRPLLPAGPGCFALVTSRAGLGGLITRDGAQAVRLGLLTEPDAEGMLFGMLGGERLQGRSAELTRLIRACGHLPLALRIAATNIICSGASGITEFTRRLEAEDPLSVLVVTGEANLAVLTAFDLSYQRLEPADQRMFRLVGSLPVLEVTRELLAVVLRADSSAVGGPLDRLANAHLLDRGPGDRFQLTGLLRHYALRLARAEDSAETRAAWRRRCVEFYLGEVASAEPEWVDQEFDNLLALVHEIARHGHRQAAWRIIPLLRPYFWSRPWQPDWLRAAEAGLSAALVDGTAGDQADLHLGLSELHLIRGGYRHSVGYAMQSLALSEESGWPDRQAAALVGLGLAHGCLGQLTEAVDHAGRALELYVSSGCLAGQARSHVCLGLALRDSGSLASALSHQLAGLDLHRRLDLSVGEASSLQLVAELLLARGRLPEALGLLEQALARQRALADLGGAAESARLVAVFLTATGHTSAAATAARGAVRLAAGCGDPHREADARNTLGHLLRQSGRPAESVRQHLLAREISELGERPAPRIAALIGLGSSRGQLPAEVRLRHLATAVEVSLARGYRLLHASALITLAEACAEDDGPAAAVRYAEEALRVYGSAGHVAGDRTAARVLARLHERSGDHRAAQRWHTRHGRTRLDFTPEEACRLAGNVVAVAEVVPEPRVST
ncbi:DNA-binding SARP family transcriptional activator/tetratricopeptide (TPR) repeat protein [Crossiella cryophila]|uniref:DNA-binding SARP family transcriptional activator/tetratricopeptide (TPR) repeat protein n=2 Tax=Crossiella cryophila TaxID=43355 RepID=A0A7W7CHR3_9PSEU|nr:DNA-binding SARP family transcriptional activator/tetratricopeptide (TPR) repeat protein [Crossiella cryophila]